VRRLNATFKDATYRAPFAPYAPACQLANDVARLPCVPVATPPASCRLPPTTHILDLTKDQHSSATKLLSFTRRKFAHPIPPKTTQNLATPRPATPPR